VNVDASASSMPVGFVGHGNPLNVAMRQRAEPWQRWARSLPNPKAVLTISAHWEDTPVTIGRTRDHDELLYDFWGFPEFMYRLRYPAPGAPALADRVEELLGAHLPVTRADRAIDHGAWCPLFHLFPQADVPVLQISMPMTMTERRSRTAPFPPERRALPAGPRRRGGRTGLDGTVPRRGLRARHDLAPLRRARLSAAPQHLAAEEEE
jgi:aromatic ring-opening dioxygenase catalytic subunit (LigB family)